jgi:D-glycero-alpha-D-manno-heptose-7-phosphate kinase
VIIARTPLRVSFFGGGTDFPEFFSRHGGAVIGTAIDKYIYHTVLHLRSWLFDYRIRVAYRKVEHVRTVDDIEHRPFREGLRYCGVTSDVEVNLSSDLPSFSGLGSSSSFTVGLIKALRAFQGQHTTQDALARAAIHLERSVLNEAVGLQDQIFAAYGGLNLIRFSGDGDFVVERIALPAIRLEELSQSLLLVYTGLTRRADDVERAKLARITDIQPNLMRMLKHVDRGYDALVGSGSLARFGELLHQTWTEKRQLDASVSAPAIDRLYETGIAAGALGGKLLGAGGGGFMLFFVPPERRPAVLAALGGFNVVPIALNAAGSTVVYG